MKINPMIIRMSTTRIRIKRFTPISFIHPFIPFMFSIIDIMDIILYNQWRAGPSKLKEEDAGPIFK